MEKRSGKIVAVYGPVVDVKFEPDILLPGIYEVLRSKTYDGKRVVLEVIEHKENNVCRCIALTPSYGLKRNAEATATGSVLQVPSAECVYGRVLNVLGEPIDKKGMVHAKQYFPIRKALPSISIDVKKKGMEFEIMETGVKMIDLLFPLVKGTKTGILGGAALGKSILTLEIIHNIVKREKGSCVFTGAGERIREGNELYFELQKADILDRVIMVFGQMNESPGARFEVVLTGITLAETLQDNGEDVLFFIDNVFRFAQAGSELSALLGRIPSETGYQPTLTSEISDFHERIRSKEGASITAVEAVYVPADDLTDPAVVAIFAHLDSIVVLSRQYVQRGLYPAIDPLASSCAYLDPAVVSKRHFDIAQEALRLFTKYEELQRIVTIIGIEELSKHERTLFERARKLQNFLTQPFFTAELYTGRKGIYVTLEETLAGCDRILSGRMDKMSDEQFYMIGALEE